VLDNIGEYVMAKNDIVQKILAAAGLTDAERASIAVGLWSRSLIRQWWLGEPGGGFAEAEASVVQGVTPDADARLSVG
jgi:hypothetical protein